MSFVPRSRLPLLVLLLLVTLGLAGCGGRTRNAEAASPPAEAVAPAAPAEESASAPAAVAEAQPSSVALAVAPAAPDVAPTPLLFGAPPEARPGVFSSKALRAPDRLELPSIKLDTPVIQLGWTSTTLETGEVMSEWEEAANSAGWHKNSKRPGFGGNVVLSGHNNILGAVFRELDLLKKGDQAFLYADNLRYEYVIDKVLVVPEKFASDAQRAANFAYIEPTGDERLTLVSCWPRDDNTHRIIVIARPVASSVVQ